MSGAITHYIHGEKVLEYFTAAGRWKNIDKTAFYWGAQGPDFLLFHRALPWMKGESLKNIGDELQNLSPETVLTVMESFPSINSPAVNSYVRGLVCHCCLDEAVKPYVNFLSQKLLKERECETPATIKLDIESSLDTIILRKEKNELPTERSMREYFPKNSEIQRVSAGVNKFLIQKLLNRNVDENIIFQATVDVGKAFSWLTDRTSFKKNFMSKVEADRPHKISALIRPFLEDMSVDYANINREEWTDSMGNVFDSDFFELVESAKEKAVQIADSLDK